MSVKFQLYDMCPCESGQQVQFCCFDGKIWNKKPTTIESNSAKSNFAHFKCYASPTYNCSTKISREHLISQYLLNNLGDDKAVKIAGLHWQEVGHVQKVPKAGLVSKILCKTHNEMLSPFDSEMGRFHATIAKYDKGFQIEQPVNEFSVFCGEDLEKWMLKTACSYIVSNQIYSGENKVDCKMQDIYIDILFSGKPFPKGWGLYVDASSDGKIQHHNYLSLSFTVTNDTLRLMKIIVNGLTFYLLLEIPTDTKQGIIFRPRGIEIKKDDIKKVMEICWQDKNLDQGVFLTYERPTIRTNEEWDNIIFKKKGSR